MAEWYYIGPDRTGINCPNCCVAFEGTNEFCEPVACPVGGESFRAYICPNPSFPTLHHVYAWDQGGEKSSVTIKVNSYFCPNNSTNCYTYEPTFGLNAGGRIGPARCNNVPRYVTSQYLCGNANPYCPPCGDCCELVEQPTALGTCISSNAGCSCSYGSVVGSCVCTCSVQQDDPSGDCYAPSSSFIDPCRDLGLNVEYYQCPNGGPEVSFCAGEIPACPEPDPEKCYGTPPYCTCGVKADCVEGNWKCPSTGPQDCNPPCGAGYYCGPCGGCICNAASTCCGMERTGWEYRPPYSCIPCYQGWEGSQGTTCCDAAFKRKRCNRGEICCNDGRCYPDYEVMCDINRNE